MTTRTEPPGDRQTWWQAFLDWVWNDPDEQRPSGWDVPCLRDSDGDEDVR